MPRLLKETIDTLKSDANDLMAKLDAHDLSLAACYLSSTIDALDEEHDRLERRDASLKARRSTYSTLEAFRAVRLSALGCKRTDHSCKVGELASSSTGPHP